MDYRPAIEPEPDEPRGKEPRGLPSLYEVKPMSIYPADLY
jgi:hypothetical protein